MTDEGYRENAKPKPDGREFSIDTQVYFKGIAEPCVHYGPRKITHEAVQSTINGELKKWKDIMLLCSTLQMDTIVFDPKEISFVKAVVQCTYDPEWKRR